MYVKHVPSRLRAQFAVVLAIAACLFFSPFTTKAYADGTFEITDWLSGYGSSSLQYIYSNNKAVNGRRIYMVILWVKSNYWRQ